MSKIKAEYGTHKTLPISVGAVSEIGLREENQDNMTAFSSPMGAVYLIADGMGGYRGGAEASRVVTEGFRQYISAAPNAANYWDTLAHAATQTNQELMQRSAAGEPQNSGMGSTAVIGIIREGDSGLELITAHVGDSRIYVHRGGALTQLTKDHTRVQWLIDNHALDEASARAHPEASVLTRAFGHMPDLKIDVSRPIPLVDGDGVLLCSDGLSGFAGSEEINQVIKQHPDPTDCAHQLVQLALARSSNDNITVQFIRIGNSPRVVVPPSPRRRPTLPEGVAIPGVSQLPPGKKSSATRNTAIGSLAAVVVLGAGVYAFHDQIPGLHTVAPKSAVPIAAPHVDKTAPAANSPVTQIVTDCRELSRKIQDLQTHTQESLKKYPSHKDLSQGMDNLRHEFEKQTNNLGSDTAENCAPGKQCLDETRLTGDKAELSKLLKRSQEFDENVNGALNLKRH